METKLNIMFKKLLTSAFFVKNKTIFVENCQVNLYAPTLEKATSKLMRYPYIYI